jgi:hypothetical protein
MSEQTAQHISPALTLTVTGAAHNGSGLIRLTTAAASRPFRTGDRVTVANIGGVPNATGTWTVTAISATVFDLVGSTFAGAFTSGGTAKRTGAA